MTKTIALTQGKVALVDDEDCEWLNAWKWAYWPEKYTGYAGRRIYQKDKSRKRIRMHRVILNPPPNMEIDHINGNGLDNRRCNLRICTHSQNLANQRKCRGTSQYKGVCWDKGRWRAQVSSAGQNIHLGYFKIEMDAAIAYNQAAQRLHGEYARLNPISKKP